MEQQNTEVKNSQILADPSLKKQHENINYLLRKLNENCSRYMLKNWHGKQFGELFTTQEAAIQYAQAIGLGSRIISKIFIAPLCEHCSAPICSERWQLEGIFLYYRCLICEKCRENDNIKFANRDDVQALIEPFKKYYNNWEKTFKKHEDRLEELPDKSGIYCITWLLDDSNKAIYIGQSTHLRSRLKAHIQRFVRVHLGKKPSCESLKNFIEKHEQEVHTIYNLHENSVEKFINPFDILYSTMPFMRWRWGDYTAPKKQNILLDAVVKNRGADFSISILELCNEEYLNKREAYWQFYFGEKKDVCALWISDTSKYLS